MTNREWLNSLSDEEFATALSHLDTTICTHCNLDYEWCDEDDAHECLMAKIKWLKAEYNEVGE